MKMRRMDHKNWRKNHDEKYHMVEENLKHQDQWQPQTLKRRVAQVSSPSTLLREVKGSAGWFGRRRAVQVGLEGIGQCRSPHVLQKDKRNDGGCGSTKAPEVARDGGSWGLTGQMKGVKRPEN